jgi:hypothetical protein
MSLQKIVKTNFTTGEISPKLRGRPDLQQYKNGVEELDNFIIQQQGGIRSRSGTRFIAEEIDSTKKSRLHNFEYNKEQAYVLEFSDLKTKVLKEGGVVTEAALTITGATKADPVVLTVTNSYSNGDHINIASVGGMTELNGKTYKVNNVSGTTVELQDLAGTNIDGTGFTTYTTGGTSSKHYTITTTFAETDIFGLAFAQSADKLYTVHEDYQPREITRTSDTSWTISEFANVDGPYFDENRTDTTITPTGTLTVGGTITLTASTAIFDSLDTMGTGGTGNVDRWIRIHSAAEVLVCQITAYTSTTVVTGTVYQFTTGAVAGDFAATKAWRLGAWSSTTGFPTGIVFHENRLCFSATPVETQSFWMSKTDDYVNFEPTSVGEVTAAEALQVADDAGIRQTLASGEINAIEWMSSSQGLFIGTVGGPFAVTSAGAAITPADISVKKQNNYGSSFLSPVTIGSSTLYVSRNNRQIRELVFNFDTDNFKSSNITVVAEHIFRQGSGAVDVAYQQLPNSVLWYCLGDGQLIGMTYLRDQQIIGFHNHSLGGEFLDTTSITSGFIVIGKRYQIVNNVGADFTDIGASANTIGTQFTATDINPDWGSLGELKQLVPGVVESIAVVPSADGSEDTLYMTVKRTINGVTKRYIEYMEKDFDPTHPQDKNDLMYLDSALTYTGAAVSSVSGLDHLEGEELGVVVNGAKHPDEVVTNGSINLDESFTNIHVGYNYNSTVKLLPLELERGDQGTPEGSIKRANSISFRLLNSLGLSHGSSLDSLTPEAFREYTDHMDISPDLITGTFKIELEQNYGAEAGYFIRQPNPFPLNILYLVTEVLVNK